MLYAGFAFKKKTVRQTIILLPICKDWGIDNAVQMAVTIMITAVIIATVIVIREKTHSF